MKGINIDETNKLVINPMDVDAGKFAVAEARTQAPIPQDFTYVEPVQFGTGCFGNPEAFNRLQEIIHSSENNNEFRANESAFQNTLGSVENASEANFSPMQDEGGAEPMFC